MVMARVVVEWLECLGQCCGRKIRKGKISRGKGKIRKAR
jgi:hypothetical protein